MMGLENLKNLRTRHNLTQIGLQIKTGIDQSLLSKYENGERIPTTENLLILARFFNTSLDYLMDLTDEIAPYPKKQDV
jgi:transcriptional regulator with XRE-family HTH domain